MDGWNTQCTLTEKGMREEAFMLDLLFGGNLLDEARQEISRRIR